MIPPALPTEVVQAILTDYRAGIPVREIGRRHNVSYQSVCKYANRSGLCRPQPKGTGTRPPEAPCLHCGEVCRSIRRECRECAVLHGGGEPNEETALDGGRWVFDPFRRVQVWAPWMDEGRAA